MDIIKVRTLEKVAIVTICNEKTLNALNIQILHEMEQVVLNLSHDDSIRVIVFTGSGKAFVAGADIKSMVNLNSKEANDFSMEGSKLFKEIENLNKITIAAVNGYALGGGCELAMSCDIRIASETATFGQPEAKLGIIPGFGGCYRLPKLIGIAKAKELIFSGKSISAIEAEKLGLVESVVPPDKLEECVIKLATTISENSFFSLMEAKSRIEESRSITLDESIISDAEAFSLCFSRGEQKEGMKAFIEKRKPAFK